LEKSDGCLRRNFQRAALHFGDDFVQLLVVRQNLDAKRLALPNDEIDTPTDGHGIEPVERPSFAFLGARRIGGADTPAPESSPDAASRTALSFLCVRPRLQ
jgi:hypothetical protein